MGGGPPPMCLEVLILVGEREERELRDPEELRSLRQREKPWKREMRGQSNEQLVAFRKRVMNPFRPPRS